MQDKGLKEDQEYIAEHGEPTFEKTRRGRPQKYNGILSLPPRENAFDLDERERVIIRNPLFSFICSLCTRSFRLQSHKDKHLEDVHKIDLRLEKPCECPVEGCDYKSGVRGIRRHMRNVHVEDPSLIRVSKDFVFNLNDI
jgi:hypothetical protein